MQAYSLQQCLREMGHEPYTINLPKSEYSIINKIKQTVKDVICALRGREGYKAFRYWPTEEQQSFMDKKTWDFVKGHISLTQRINSIKELYKTDFSEYDAFIVGSDQVWRYAYLSPITAFFFDFLPSDKPRMSYAASFGISDLGYSISDKIRCKELLNNFNVVTVREYDGIKICEREFGIKAKKVVDPVFLQNKAHYLKMASFGTHPNQGKKYIFTYILDWNKEKRDYIGRLSNERQLTVVNMLPEKFHLVGPKMLEYLVYPSVLELLRGFADAECIITDSFHGTAFSILLNKTFGVFANQNRGNSRLISVLKTFGLEDHIVKAVDYNIPEADYNTVNRKIKELSDESKSVLEGFLQKSIRRGI